MQLNGRKALITGASRGIGRAIAIAFAQQGAQVALAATSADRLVETAAMCQEQNKLDVAMFGLDVRDPKACEAAVKATVDKFGGLDIVVNNAGVTRDNLLMRLSDEDYDAVLDTNLRGAFNITRAASRPLMKSKAGRLINIASVVGIVGNAGQANYAASKGGLIAFTKSVAKELAGRGVTANVIAPGFIETDMTASLDAKVKEEALKGIRLGRFGKPEDIAQAAVYLASDAGSYITAQVLVIDGGMTA
ncbi:MAG: 3-oxoacyl-[acyl-carrier-protein] reductase [Planctomycetes bacterium]|nr:3-oxoacyl-[acyl-carrier-protein] reductase [Planctomycetota bacterium]MCW8134131.1 3-oxoacyl-[acyl-carrier-protein] reductase [Planctomycetota bacterium]